MIIESGEVSKIFNYRCAHYNINGVKVTFYLSDHFLASENVVKKGYNVISVSFSNNNNPVPYDIICYTLSYFGFNTMAEYHVNTKTHRNYNDNSFFKTVYYEQLTQRKV